MSDFMFSILRIAGADKCEEIQKALGGEVVRVPKTRIKAVSYVRVSTDEQVKGIGLQVQQKAISMYCKRSGMRVLTEFKDEGISGSNIKDRPGILCLIDGIELGQVQHIVVYAIDRLSRNLDDLRYLKRLCVEYSVSIHTTMSGVVDFESVEGNLLYNITGIMAETEMLIIKNRTKDALSLKKEQHKLTGGVPYGSYVRSDNTLVKKTSEQKVITFVRNKYRNGFCLAEIVKLLKKKKLLSRKKKPFVAQQVKRMLNLS